MWLSLNNDDKCYIGTAFVFLVQAPQPGGGSSKRWSSVAGLQKYDSLALILREIDSVARQIIYRQIGKRLADLGNRGRKHLEVIQTELAFLHLALATTI